VKYRFFILILTLSAPALWSSIARADTCSAAYAKSMAVFTSKEIKQIRELQVQATSREYSSQQRKKSLVELLDITQSRLKELGFKTRRRTIANSEMDGGKETLIQILEAPEELPIGKVINNVKERYDLRVGIDPILEKSAMDTPAYFGSDENLAVLDVLNFRSKADVPQDFLHEIRHRYYLQLLKDGKADVHHGSVSTVSKSYHLENAGGPYDEFISFEELSTYFRDANVALTNLALGKITKKYARGVLGDLHTLSSGIAKSIDQIDWALDISKIQIDRRAKTVTYPLYDGKPLKKNLLAEFSYPMPEITSQMSKEDIIAQFKQDFFRVRAIAEERIECAEDVLRKLRPPSER
jgi:hypothetical protein